VIGNPLDAWTDEGSEIMAASAGARFRDLIRRDGVLHAPGAHDALTALIAQDVGFEAVYLGGFACGASAFGVPDHSSITMTELLEQARRVVAVVDLPVIADIDDAGGNALNAQRCVRLAERSGLAGVHIEDVVAGKHFPGHPDDLLATRVFADRIRAALDARLDDDFVVIARSDTQEVDTMLERAAAVQRVGADMLFMPYLRNRDVARVASAVEVPILHIAHPMTDLGELGVKVLIHPAVTLLAEYQAARQALTAIRDGTAPSHHPSTLTDINRLVGSPGAVAVAERYGMLRTEALP
jgi:2-methylisocitrate lyase-like PEP mutase family enzyme